MKTVDSLEALLNVGIWEACAERGIASWTKRCAELLGIESANKNGELAELLIGLGDEDYQKLLEILRLVQQDKQPRSFQCTGNLLGEGTRMLAFQVSSQHSDLPLLCSVKEDNEAQNLAKMRKVACYDALTGLPNMLLFREQLSYATKVSKRDRSIVAALTIELCDLRRITDVYGRAVSDLMLKTVAARIGNSVRSSDSVATGSQSIHQGGLARIENSQFAVVLQSIREPQDAARVAKRMLEQMSAPIFIDGIENYAAINIGIAICPWDGDTPDQVAQASSLALDNARKAGSNRAVFFNRNMNAQATDRLALEAGIRRALENNEFVLHYQHRVDGRTGRVIGHEGLIRWMHPEKGLLYPGAFISAAEESRLIMPMGNWVIEEACRQNRRWLDKGFPATPVAVNVSSVQFAAPGFISTVKRALDLSDLPPECLELEITESVVMNDTRLVIEKLKELKRIGCLVAIDDFGTGFSSLAYLRDLPADCLKIDRSFVVAATKDSRGAAITQAIIDLGNRLDMAIVAEGIETEEQKQLLLKQGCYDFQGFLFSKPCDALKTEESWKSANRLNLPIQKTAKDVATI